ncbi:MAG: hypothetical protein GF331_12865 [Chitinivibrionales bacterium]|nr:hypothetical protein [Chitinivibrionales bacterium]
MVKAPKRIACALTVVSAAVFAGAATYHVDPVNGSSGGDGSAGRPWRSIQRVVEDESLRGGDVLLLHDGYHGELSVRSQSNREYITVRAAEGETPRLRRITLSSVERWRFEGLSISPYFDDDFERGGMVYVRSGSREIVFERCTLRTREDCSNWSASDWDRRSCDGFLLDGVGHVIRNNVVENVNFGMSVSADSCLVEHNYIDGFAGDGIRALGDYCVYQYNIIKNSKDVNGNHDDGIQSYSIGRNGVGTSTVYGVVLRGNLIINYEDRNQPHRGSMQGIGCFDGMFEDWLVEHNVLIVDTWHGITLRGAVNCTIRNNTVCAPNRADVGPPWIKLQSHKNGTPATGCVVERNLVTKLVVSSDQARIRDNLIMRDPHDWVEDFDSFNMRIRDDSEARGGASDGEDIGAYVFAGQQFAVSVIAPAERNVSSGVTNGRRAGLTRGDAAMFDLRGRWNEIATGRRRGATGIYVTRKPSNEGGAAVLKQQR